MICGRQSADINLAALASSAPMNNIASIDSRAAGDKSGVFQSDGANAALIGVLLGL